MTRTKRTPDEARALSTERHRKRRVLNRELAREKLEDAALDALTEALLQSREQALNKVVETLKPLVDKKAGGIVVDIYVVEAWLDEVLEKFGK